MKDMNYIKKRQIDILHKGKYKGYLFCIISLGTHPCAYVCLPKGHKYYQKSYDDIPIGCHYGLTFASDDFHFNPVYQPDVWWIGWDYAHAGDYMGYDIIFDKSLQLPEDKKWKTHEIFEEVKKVIEQLIIGNKQ